MIKTLGHLAAATVMALAMVGTAHAATWRLSSMMPPDSFEGQAYQKFADLVDKYTDGAIKVRIYPNEQIGPMNSVAEQLSKGVIQLAPSAVTFLARWEDGIRYASAPFLFDDYKHWSNFVNGELFQTWLKSVDEKAHITILGKIPDMPRGTFRTLLSRKPIKSADDIAGLKIRQFKNQLVIDAWTYLGAEVRVLPWGEVYDAINRGIVDSVTSPAELIKSMRFNEVAPNIIRTDEYPQAVAWMMNAGAWNALTPDQKKAMTRAHAEASAFARKALEEQAKTLESDLKAVKGTTVNFGFDTAPLVAKMAVFYKERAKTGKLPQGLLEAVDAARTK